MGIICSLLKSVAEYSRNIASFWAIFGLELEVLKNGEVNREEEEEEHQKNIVQQLNHFGEKD